MSVKEKVSRILPQVKSTNIVTTAILIIAAAFALINTPQMIGLANAQSERASERACPVGYTLSRGECTAELIPGEPECIPSSVGGVKAEVVPSTFNTLCLATLVLGSQANQDEFISECREITQSSIVFDNILRTILCAFPITPGEPTCPGGIPPTEEGECITKPGRGNNPT